MDSKKIKGFTLMELIAVLVIMAIIALIVTPLVMNIIRKAKISARKRSVDTYGRSVELAIASYLLDTGTFPSDLRNLTVEYSGQTVLCNVMAMKENGGLYMSECTVNNIDVKDSSTDDGWYHYGTRDLTNEEYVDMYGDALKTASLAYYNANNQTVTDYTILTVDYKGKPVSCDVTVNYDGTIYMTNCKVNNASVTSETEEDGYYHYGEYKLKSYVIGDEVTYNGIDFYVLEDSSKDLETVKLFKVTPFTTYEVNLYGNAGTENSHVNLYANDSVGTAYNSSLGYGGVAYYTSEDCGVVDGVNKENGCKVDYKDSEIKYIIDAWVNDKFNFQDVIESRLIFFSEYNGLSSVKQICLNNNYLVWTMDNIPSLSLIGVINTDCGTVHGGMYYSVNNIYPRVVQPVIIIKKSVLS